MFNTIDTQFIVYKRGKGWAFNHYIIRDKLAEDLLSNRDLKLRFVIEIIDFFQNIENRVINDLQKLVNNKELSHFLFIVHNKELFAHKNILSVRSKVFEAMFDNHIIESHLNQCIIDDIESHVFEELLTFKYTANAPKAQSMAHKLLTAAQKYEILDLKDIVKTLYLKT